MIKYLAAAFAALCLAGCVTPMPVADQQPQFSYAVPDRTLVAVVDDRARLHAEHTGQYAGIVRVYGIPSAWTTDVLMNRQPASEKGLTLAQLLSRRIAGGINQGGGQAQAVEVTAAPTDEAARELLQSQQASRLLTVDLSQWFFDVNTSWVGRFRYETEMNIIVQTASGTTLNKHFHDDQAIQARGDESWPNLILEANRAKLEQIFNDPEVRGALTAPSAAAAPAEALTN